MKALILTKNLIPFPTTYGTAIQAWSFATTLVSRGYDVHLCVFAFDAQKGKMEWDRYGQESIFALLEKEHITVHLIEKNDSKVVTSKSGKWVSRLDRINSAIHPDIEEIFEIDLYRNRISDLIREINPDFICAWTDYAANVIDPSLPYPLIAVTTDLIHLARKYKRSMMMSKGLRSRYNAFLANLQERKLSQNTVRVLKRCVLVFNHAKHHADWLRRHGIPNVNYYPIPVLPPDQEWVKKETNDINSEKFRVTLIGNVSGVATLSGLFFLANEVLPELESQMDTKNLEIHIVGGGELQEDLKVSFNKPYIKLRGYVNQIEPEYLNCDIFLVPTTIELGFRTRIAEGFSYGCCTIAHQSNQLGMPELISGENCLLAATGKEMANQIRACYQSQELRKRLSQSALATYHETLNGEMICNQMVDDIEKVIHRDET